MAITERKRKDGSPYFMIDFRDHTGTRVRETVYGSRTDAKDMLAARRAAVWRAKQGMADAYVNQKKAIKQAAEERGPTFHDFIRDTFMPEVGSLKRSNYYAEALSETGALMAFFGKLLLREITADHLREFSRERREAVSSSTVRKNLIALGTIFKHAKRRKLIAQRPDEDLEKPPADDSEARPFTLEEWRRVEAQLAAQTPALLPLARFALATGARLKEVAGVRWADVNLQAGSVLFTSDNKTGKAKRVALSDAALEVIGLLPETKPHAFVFVKADGTDYTAKRERNRVSQRFGAACRKVSLGWASFKSLRTTGASWAEEADVPVERTQRMLGHADVRTTQRFYTKTQADLTRPAVDAVSRHLRLVPGVRSTTNSG